MKPAQIFIFFLLLLLFACKSDQNDKDDDNLIHFDSAYIDGFATAQEEILTKIVYDTIDGLRAEFPSRKYSYFVFRGREYMHGEDIAFFSDSSIKDKSQYEDGLRTGEYLEYYAPDSLKIKCYYKEGKRNGSYASFYRTGEKFEESTFVEGLLEDEFVLYFRNGKVKQKERFKDGNLEGLAEVFFEDGSLKSKIFYKEGKPWNLIAIYDHSGSILAEESLKNGKGLYAEYTDAGQKIMEVPMKKGLGNGLATYYDSTGRVEIKAPFRNGKIKGMVRTFHENGEIAQQVKMLDNITLDFKQYNQEGTLIWEIPFKKPPYTYMDSISLNLIDFGGGGNLKQLSSIFQGVGPRGSLNGIKHGCEKRYFSNGNVKKVICYKNGEEEGGR